MSPHFINRTCSFFPVKHDLVRFVSWLRSLVRWHTTGGDYGPKPECFTRRDEFPGGTCARLQLSDGLIRMQFSPLQFRYRDPTTLECRVSSATRRQSQRVVPVASGDPGLSKSTTTLDAGMLVMTTLHPPVFKPPFTRQVPSSAHVCISTAQSSGGLDTD